MPLYEYRCGVCGKKCEKLVRATDADKQKECPHCGAESLERQVSLFGGLFGGCGTSGGYTGGG